MWAAFWSPKTIALREDVQPIVDKSVRRWASNNGFFGVRGSSGVLQLLSTLHEVSPVVSKPERFAGSEHQKVRVSIFLILVASPENHKIRILSH